MTHASLSPEGRIESGLRSIGCSQRQFADIACAMGHPVSAPLISLCLSGKREFTPWTAEVLLNLLGEMRELRDYFRDVPIHWGSFERVTTLVVLRRAEQAGADVDAARAANSGNQNK